MANGEHEQDLGKTSGEGEPSSSLPKGIPDYGRILRKALEGLGPIDPTQPVLKRGDHLGSRGRPEMHVDWSIAGDAKDQLPPRVIQVDPSMVTDPGDSNGSETNMRQPSGEWCFIVGDVQIRPREMRDSGCVDPRGCDAVDIQNIPNVGSNHRSYGTIGRGTPYIDQVSYEDVTGQSIEQPNSFEIDD